MARIGISITKSVPFRNSNQEFSNVYYYEGYPDFPNQATAEGFIDDMKAKEVPWHSTGVTFVRGRLWKQIGTPGQNEMIAQKNLSGTGSSLNDTTQDRERAVLVRRRAGTDVRGNPVYLRKWFHCAGGFGSVGFAAGVLANTSSISQANRDTIAGLVGDINTLGPIGNQGNICAKNGRQPGTGTLWECHAFFEHHQLGDQWRRQ
jgi:hypothetical protein